MRNATSSSAESIPKLEPGKRAAILHAIALALDHVHVDDVLNRGREHLAPLVGIVMFRGMSTLTVRKVFVLGQRRTRAGACW
jgi:hypothetical protein